MKTVKLVLWIFILYIIQNIFYPIMSISGVIPDLLLGFVVAYSTVERRLAKLSPVIIICAVIAGTGTGRVFPIVTFFVGLSGATSYLMCSNLRYVPNILRVAVITAVFVYAISIAEFFVQSGMMTSAFLTGNALWRTLYTVIASSIIYLIINKSVNKNNEKKLLIV